MEGADAAMKRRILELARAGDCAAIIRLAEGWLSEPQASTKAKPERKALTIAEAATALGISPRGVWRQLGLNNLDAIRIGRCTRVTAASIDRMLKNGGAPA